MDRWEKDCTPKGDDSEEIFPAAVAVCPKISWIGADEIDLLVAYIVPEDIRYIFPPSAFRKMKSLRLFPCRGKKLSKFEPYREAWHAFREVK